ncbi:hypothetical protein RF11_07390 [Thelohanellus kitauei]|uniref:Uncharacterized protein n=1 Tax=Thelohanellus kitauei TaxID=669202 RepID=A0A0C2MXN9_THEKT|nr:hypothetical protein RF11_07190 [Thelohanellus kitauei]KII66397.1 hypothetical protein RF11_07390 [Thelohanellus kitauei]
MMTEERRKFEPNMRTVNISKENSHQNKKYLISGLKNYYFKVAQNEIDLCDDLVELAVKSELTSHDKISQTIIQYVTNFIKNAKTVVNGRPWTPDDGIFNFYHIANIFHITLTNIFPQPDFCLHFLVLFFIHI